MILSFFLQRYFFQAGYASTNNINRYFRSRTIVFDVPYTEGSQPAVTTVSVIDYQNSNESARVYPLISGVTNKQFVLYVVDPQEQIGGSSTENAFTVCLIAIGRLV